VQNHLSAKINTLYENNYDAIEAMEKNYDENEDFPLALLYARIGDFALASSHLEAAISKGIQPLRAPLEFFTSHLIKSLMQTKPLVISAKEMPTYT